MNKKYKRFLVLAHKGCYFAESMGDMVGDYKFAYQAKKATANVAKKMLITYGSSCTPYTVTVFDCDKRQIISKVVIHG